MAAAARAVYQLGEHLFLVVVDEGLARGFDASAYRLADGRCSSVVHADGSRVVSPAPTTRQATARLVQQLETYIGAIGREATGFDTTAFQGSGETWALPG